MEVERARRRRPKDPRRKGNPKKRNRGAKTMLHHKK
jgi:hypothetical protein